MVKIRKISPIQKDIEDKWIEEVERRKIDLQSGKTKKIPGEEVFKQIQSRIQS